MALGRRKKLGSKSNIINKAISSATKQTKGFKLGSEFDILIGIVMFLLLLVYELLQNE